MLKRLALAAILVSVIGGGLYLIAAPTTSLSASQAETLAQTDFSDPLGAIQGQLAINTARQQDGVDAAKPSGRGVDPATRGNKKGHKDKSTTTTAPATTTTTSEPPIASTSSTTTTKPPTTTTTTTKPPTTTTTRPPTTTTTRPPTTTTTTTKPPASNSPTDATIYPGESIQQAVNANPEGTVFTIKSGVHKRQEVVPTHRQQFIGEAGAVLDGEDVAQYAFASGAVDVVIKGLIIENYATPLRQGGAIYAHILGAPGPCGANWLVADNEIRNNAAAGIGACKGIRIINNYIHHNDQIGIVGPDAALIEGNEIAYNTSAAIPRTGVERGGLKVWNTDGVVIRNNYAHHNGGNGLHTDGNNINVLYEGNRVEYNDLNGIMHEVGYDAIIRNNVAVGNGLRDGSLKGLDGAGIHIANSSNVEVYGNTVIDNLDGIGGVHVDRGSGSWGPRELRNLWVHDNRIVMSVGNTGIAEWGTSSGGAVFDGWNNRFDYNTYELGSGTNYFRWDLEVSTEEWLATGQDAHSTFK